MKDESICRQITIRPIILWSNDSYLAQRLGQYIVPKYHNWQFQFSCICIFFWRHFSFPFTNRIKKRIIYHLARARWGADFHVQWLGAGMREQMKLKNTQMGVCAIGWLSGYWQWIFALRITEKNFKLRNNSVNIFIDDNLLIG